jgi:hypothetical protein
MTYTIRNSNWQWLIEPEPDGKRCILKCKRPVDWTECNRFDTPEAAAEAVANGTTGQKEWDELKRETPVPGLASWLIDPMGGPMAVVKEVLKAVIPPAQSGPGTGPATGLSS